MYLAAVYPQNCMYVKTLYLRRTFIQHYELTALC